jgi:hypothetical protein
MMSSCTLTSCYSGEVTTLGPVMSIGSSDDMDLVVPNDPVSFNKLCGKHAILCGEMLFDNDTTNGTWVAPAHDGRWERLTPLKPQRLLPGHRICFAGNPDAPHAAHTRRHIFVFDTARNTCCICYEHTVHQVITLCKHPFCSNCLARWLASSDSNRCPMCRQAVYGDRAADEGA